MVSAINQIRVYTHCNNLGGKVWNPAIRWTHKHAVFIELEVEGGIVGTGECWCFDSSPDTLVAFIRFELSSHFIGLSLDEFENTYKRLTTAATLTARHGILASALSGFDIAVWDVRAQLVQKPLWAVFNPTGAGCVSLYASGGLYGVNKSNSALAQEMTELSAKGFSLLKMKIGALDIDEDLHRVKCVLKAIPEDSRLIIDGVYRYSVEQAAHLYKSLPKERIEAFQSPLSAGDIDGMSALVSSGVPVMATEAEYRYEIHEKLFERNAVSFLQSAPIACGGYTRLKELNSAAQARRIRLSLEVSSTAIALMAACHFGAAYDQVAHVEYHTVHQVFFHQIPLRNFAGYGSIFQLPDVPGLGMSLPIDQVDLAFIVN